MYTLLSKISNTIDNIIPVNEIKIKNDTQNYFDNGLVEAIKIREKHFKRFTESNPQIDYNLCIDVKYNTQKLLKQTKLSFLHKIN